MPPLAITVHKIVGRGMLAVYLVSPHSSPKKALRMLGERAETSAEILIATVGLKEIGSVLAILDVGISDTQGSCVLKTTRYSSLPDAEKLIASAAEIAIRALS